MTNPAIRHGGKTLQDINDVAGGALNPSEEKAVNPAEATEETGAVTIDDIFDQIANKPKAKKKKQLTVYIDKEVYDAFSAFANRKGDKSEVINSFLKAKFKI